jgi:four helix bundle protein
MNQRDIEHRTFRFACAIVRFSDGLGGLGTHRILGTQLLKAGTSIGANLEEARAAQSRADFVTKCHIALKEARETLYWLRLLDACAKRPLAGVKELIDEANQLVAIITVITRKAKQGLNPR